MNQPMEIGLDRQIACVKREIALRERVYPKWVAMRRMTQAEADKEIATMTAVLHTLMNLHAPIMGGIGG